jgi:hypothetical protein
MDQSRLVEGLRRGPLEGLDPGDAVELLLWLDHREAAAEHVRAALDANPRMADIYHHEYERLRGAGLERLAFSSRAGQRNSPTSCKHIASSIR